MTVNLIKAGLINPMQFPVRRVLQEVARELNISTERIEVVGCCEFRLWVNIQGVGGRFVSYRRLPIWLDAAIDLIKSCNNLEDLQQLGNLFQIELQEYSEQYNPKTIETLRSTWKQRRNYLQAEEIRLAPIIARQQQAQRWQTGWLQVLHYTHNREFLQFVMAEIQRQKQQFQDLPDVVEAVEQIWLDRWQELTNKIDVF